MFRRYILTGTEVDIKTTAGVKLDGGALYFKKGEFVIIDSVFKDKCGNLGVTFPFVGKYKDYGVTFGLYSDSGNLGSQVFEVMV